MARVVLVFSFLLLALVAVGRGQISQLEKLIEHFRQAETRQAQLLRDLEGGVLVMAIPHTGSQRIPMRRAEMLDYLVSLAVTAELGKSSPDVAAAEKRARDLAETYFRNLKPYNDAEIAKLKKSLAQLQDSRKRAEARLKEVKGNQSTVEEGKFDLEGKWRRDTDGWEVTVARDLDGGRVIGVNRFVPEFARYAFSAGERIWEFKRDTERPDTYTGKWMFRMWTGGDKSSIKTEWRAVTVRFADNDHLLAGDGSGNWTRIGADELAGVWQVRVSTPFSYYLYRWDIRRDADGIWTAEQTLLDTDHGFHRARIGKKFHSYTLTKKGDLYEVYGSETDENPGNPGSFTQKGTIKLTKDGLSGEGEHKGTRLTHWIKFSGTRQKS